MTNTVVLALLNFSKPFVVEMNASNIGVRVVLIQTTQPISYFSQSLCKMSQVKLVYERELMAIIFAM